MTKKRLTESMNKRHNKTNTSQQNENEAIEMDIVTNGFSVMVDDHQERSVVETCSKYTDYPLVYSMIKYEKVRTASLKEEGKCQIMYPSSNDGWIITLFNWKGRAFDWMAFPWFVTVTHAIIYTTVQQLVYENPPRSMVTWEIFFSFVLNSTLALLMVFRLNRAAERYWISRKFWGEIVARTRSLVGGILVHATKNCNHRDDAIRYIIAFSLSTMEYLRGTCEHLPRNDFAGILTTEQIEILEKQVHPPLYAADKVRYNIKQLFRVDTETPTSIAIAWTQQLNTLEEQLNSMIWSCGGMERIKATPLPIVYVSHLRTFLMINLFLFPWVFGPAWGWSTIPIVAVAAIAWLGIECASIEVECPFRKDRVNALDMNTYVIGLIANIQQQIQNNADHELLDMNDDHIHEENV